MITNNKKSMVSILGVVLIFGLLFLVIFFATILLKDIGKTEVLDRIDTVAINNSEALGLSTEMQEFIHDQPEEFNNINLQYDLFFLLAFISLISFGLVASYKAAELGFISFFGFLFLGMAMFLYISVILNVVSDWFILNLVEGFVEFDLLTTPIINWYFTNFNFVNFIIASLFLLVNRLTFSLNRDSTEDINVVGGSEGFYK